MRWLLYESDLQLPARLDLISGVGPTGAGREEETRAIESSAATWASSSFKRGQESKSRQPVIVPSL
jgi:hypothetical protein